METQKNMKDFITKPIRKKHPSPLLKRIGEFLNEHNIYCCPNCNSKDIEIQILGYNISPSFRVKITDNKFIMDDGELDDGNYIQIICPECFQFIKFDEFPMQCIICDYFKIYRNEENGECTYNPNRQEIRDYNFYCCKFTNLELGITSTL